MSHSLIDMSKVSHISQSATEMPFIITYVPEQTAEESHRPQSFVLNMHNISKFLHAHPSQLQTPQLVSAQPIQTSTILVIDSVMTSFSCLVL